MKQTGKRIMAFLAVLCICVINVANYGNVVLAGSYESEEIVVETENWKQNGKAVINGIVKEEGILSDIQTGIVRSLDDKTQITNTYQWGDNLFQNDRALYAKNSITIHAGKVKAQQIIAAKSNIVIHSSQLQADDFTIICAMDGDIEIHAGDMNFKGIIYAPKGKVKMEASHIQFEGRMIAKSVEISAGVVELDGNPECSNVIDKLSFLTEDMDIGMTCDYEEDTQKYQITLDEDLGELFARKEILVRYNDEVEFQKLCDFTEEEFYIPIDYQYLDVVVKIETIFGMQSYTNIRSFQISEGEFYYVKRDTDEDGITDGDEILFTKTSPFEKDTDKDGFNDYEECFILYTNPNEYTEDGDFDKDGLTNREEIAKGTHPYIKDCDMDGIPDGKDAEPFIANGEVTKENIAANLVMPIGKFDKVLTGWDENGNTYQYVFDFINQTVKSSTYNNQSIYFFYDAKQNKILDIRTVKDEMRVNCLKYDERENVNAYYNHGDIYTYEYDQYDNIVKASMNGQEVLTQKKDVLLYGNADELEVSQQQIYENDTLVSTYEEENDRRAVYVDEENQIQYEYTYDEEGKLKEIASDSGFRITYEYHDEYKKITYHYHDDIKEQIIYYDENKNPKSTTTLGGFQVIYEAKEDKGYYSIGNEGAEWKEEYTFDDNHIVKVIKSDGREVTYQYNENNQVSSVYEEQQEIYKYEYNEIGQLEKYYDFKNCLLEEYTYDLYNNLLKTQQYKWQDNEKQEKIWDESYGYKSDLSHDVLTSINGEKVEYDAIGNPTEYFHNMHLEWFGKTLKYAEQNGHSVDYSYNADGTRTSKTVDGRKTMYYLEGNDIIAEVWEDDIIWYMYDTDANVIGFMYHDNAYFYEKNAGNDVEKILDKNGTIICEYTYDAWGNITGITGDQDIAAHNPFRYKSYYYDNETGFYYLQTRYYDPQVRRFISMDAVEDVPYEMIDANLYAYCVCDPVNLYDPYGQAAVKIAIFTITEFADESKKYLQQSLERTWNQCSITLKSSDKKQDFTNWWNGLGVKDIVIINSHGDNTRINGKVNLTSTIKADKAELKKVYVKLVVLLGCNTGHFNYYTTNIAMALATKTSGVVIASDGTVAGTDKKKKIFGKNNISFKSMPDAAFKGICTSKSDEKSKLVEVDRDNFGWLVYNGKTGHCYTLQTKMLSANTIYGLHNNNHYFIYK